MKKTTVSTKTFQDLRSFEDWEAYNISKLSSVSNVRASMSQGSWKQGFKNALESYHAIGDFSRIIFFFLGLRALP